MAKDDSAGRPLPRLSWPERLAWMVCAMPELLKSFSWDFFVLFFYAQVVGLNGWFLGLAIAVIIVFDTIVDPWIGALSDRMEGARFGRRHTLMLAAIVPFMIGILGVFSPPQRHDQRPVDRPVYRLARPALTPGGDQSPAKMRRHMA
ncbi:MAG: MFS transporter [Novosphingobium sp.]